MSIRLSYLNLALLFSVCFPIDDHFSFHDRRTSCAFLQDDHSCASLNPINVEALVSSACGSLVMARAQRDADKLQSAAPDSQIVFMCFFARSARLLFLLDISYKIFDI